MSAISVQDAGEIERKISKFPNSPNGGLILTTSALAVVHRDLIIALAARYKLPAVYYRRIFATEGGLISYGYDAFAQFSGAAAYVDRILKGEKAADLPVHVPTKYQIGNQPEACQGAGITATFGARPRRRVDRVKVAHVRYWRLGTSACALHMSAFDPKRTSVSQWLPIPAVSY